MESVFHRTFLHKRSVKLYDLLTRSNKTLNLISGLLTLSGSILSMHMIGRMHSVSDSLVLGILFRETGNNLFKLFLILTQAFTQ